MEDFHSKYLIVVDMQNDFVNGSLGSEEAKQIIPNVVECVEEARENNVEIIWTMDTHHKNYLETQEGKKLPIEHCIINTDGWNLVEPLNPNGEEVFYKETFGSLPMVKYIHNWHLTNGKGVLITLIGLCTDICVISNAILLKTMLPEAVIRVKENCCAGSAPENHKHAIETMNSLQIEII